jgi:hypothetical protein
VGQHSRTRLAEYSAGPSKAWKDRRSEDQHRTAIRAQPTPMAKSTFPSPREHVPVKFMIANGLYSLRLWEWRLPIGKPNRPTELHY